MHVCLFDIDGTLLNTGGAGQAAMEAAVAAEFGISTPFEGIPTAGRTDRAIAIDLLEQIGLGVESPTFQQFQAAYMRHLPTHLAARDGLVLPGIHELLDDLSVRDDVVLGLLTGNFHEGARLKLAHYKLDHHFQFGGFGDHHVDRDDVARAALAQVHSRLDGSLNPDRLWVIGDTPADVRCGRAIGARVIAVATGSYTVQELQATDPDHLFDDFSDLQPFLALLG